MPCAQQAPCSQTCHVAYHQKQCHLRRRLQEPDEGSSSDDDAHCQSALRVYPSHCADACQRDTRQLVVTTASERLSECLKNTPEP